MVAVIRSKITNFFVHGHERTLLAKKNIALSFVIKGGNILISLVLVPMTIGYVSPAQYGIWLTISSVMGWLNFFDVGLGNGLRNKLTTALAMGEIKQAKVFISTTYICLTFIASFLFVLFYVANPYINWQSILNVKTESKSVLMEIMLVAFGFFCIQFVTQLINTISSATHQSANASFLSFFGQLFSLLAVYYCIHSLPGSLLILVVIIAGIPVLTQIIGTLFIFKSSLKNIAPSLDLINLSHVGDLLNTGGTFFLIQLGALILFQTNQIIISQLLGPEQVTTFGVCYKLFSVTLMIFTIMMTPMWSSFTDAYTKSDFNWLKGSIQRIRKLFLYFSLITIVILGCSPYLFTLWLTDTVTIPFSLSVCTTVYIIASIWQTAHVYLLNGIGKIRLQLILVTSCALINIPLSLFLGKLFGLCGIISTNSILFIIMGIVFSIQCDKLINQHAVNIWSK